MTTLTREEIAEQRRLLRRITDKYRATIERHIAYGSLPAVSHELDGLIRAAQDEIRFLARVGIDPDEPPDI